MNTSDWLGSIAAILTTTSFIPQVIQVWRTRHTKDISFGMYVIFTAGVATWLVYGVMLNSWPIIIANGITVCLAGSVLLMKLRFGWHSFSNLCAFNICQSNWLAQLKFFLAIGQQVMKELPAITAVRNRKKTWPYILILTALSGLSVVMDVPQY
jgi:MtN3 and saliva related transmembrane protein